MTDGRGLGPRGGVYVSYADYYERVYDLVNHHRASVWEFVTITEADSIARHIREVELSLRSCMKRRLVRRFKLRKRMELRSHHFPGEKSYHGTRKTVFSGTRVDHLFEVIAEMLNKVDEALESFERWIRTRTTVTKRRGDYITPGVPTLEVGWKAEEVESALIDCMSDIMEASGDKMEERVGYSGLR
jgi:hypothetical protein